jgi:hypothetical protein
VKRPGALYKAGMHEALELHPDSRCSAITQIEVEAVRSRARGLLLRYVVRGAIGDLCIPPTAASVRADELWRHTCFEAFICPAPGEPYYEFNFAPSTRWAAYRFDGYRSGMRIATEIGAPRIEVESVPERFTLQAALELDALPSSKWRLGLAAAIEDASNRLYYWALAHPPRKPDFHRADCFICEI